MIQHSGVARPRNEGTELKSMVNELMFRSSPEAPLGVELEFQLIERESSDLALGAVAS